MTRQIVLDTETTGLSPKEGHRIIEVGCIELINRQITGNKLHFYCNPEREIEQAAIAIHGLTEEFLADKPLFSEKIVELLEFIKDAELIIHNAPFDVKFLDHEFKLVNKSYKRIKDYCKILDTLKLARLKHPGQQNSLDVLCRRYEVDNSDRQLHGALLDAKLLAQVYLCMTGGQAQLFQSENLNSTAVASETRQTMTTATLDLPVILADEKELSAHQKIVTETLTKK